MLSSECKMCSFLCVGFICFFIPPRSLNLVYTIDGARVSEAGRYLLGGNRKEQEGEVVQECRIGYQDAKGSHRRHLRRQEMPIHWECVHPWPNSPWIRHLH